MVEKPHGPFWWPDLYQPLRQMGEKVAEWISPASEAKSGKATYEIRVELPGVKKEDVEIELHDGVLTVKGEKRSETTEEGEGFFFSERQYGKFQRTFRLPADAAEDGVEARYADGLLTIDVPKAVPEAQKPRRIAVKG